MVLGGFCFLLIRVVKAEIHIVDIHTSSVSIRRNWYKSIYELKRLECRKQQAVAIRGSYVLPTRQWCVATDGNLSEWEERNTLEMHEKIENSILIIASGGFPTVPSWQTICVQGSAKEEQKKNKESTTTQFCCHYWINY